MIKCCLALFFLLIQLGLTACVGPVASPVSRADQGVISGKLTVAQLPLAGARLEAYPLGSPTLSGPPLYQSNVTGADGLYQLELPPGKYFFLARGAGYFSYYGRNPVTVPTSGLQDINLVLVGEGAERPAGEPFVAGGLFGRTTYRGAPLEGVMIYVYLDLTSDLKGMGYVMSGPSDANGLFESELPAGRYYLLARKRQTGSAVGPLQAGDFIGYYPNNPLTLTQQQVVKLTVPMQKVPDKVDRLADKLFGETVISGTISDPAGQPLSGLRAVLYSDPQMFNRPLYVSQPTGKDGTFVLSFPSGGTYYLAARNTLGGAPAPGDLYGTYNGSPDHSLVLEDGQSLRGIEVVVEEMW